MSAWLLWLRRHPGDLWRRYITLLPQQYELCCLLNYHLPDEIEALQFAELKREAEVQARW